MNGCFERNTEGNLKSALTPFSRPFPKHCSPISLEAYCVFTKTRTLPDLLSRDKQSVRTLTTSSRRALGTSFGHVCLYT